MTKRRKVILVIIIIIVILGTFFLLFGGGHWLKTFGHQEMGEQDKKWDAVYFFQTPYQQVESVFKENMSKGEFLDFEEWLMCVDHQKEEVILNSLWFNPANGRLYIKYKNLFRKGEAVIQTEDGSAFVDICSYKTVILVDSTIKSLSWVAYECKISENWFGKECRCEKVDEGMQ